MTIKFRGLSTNYEFTKSNTPPSSNPPNLFSNSGTAPINESLLLLTLILSNNTNQDSSRLHRAKYQQNTGRYNKIHHGRKPLVLKKDIIKITHQSQPSPSSSSNRKQELKKIFEKQKSDNKIIENLDFSGLDLSDFDFNDTHLRNCNFKGAKMPSMSFVSIDNNCNFDDSDWSNTTQNFVRFGSPESRDKTVELISLSNGHQLHHNNISTFDDHGDILVSRINTKDKTHQDIEESIEQILSERQHIQDMLKIRNANFQNVNFQTFVVYDADFTGSDFSASRFRINQGNRGSKTSFILQNASNIDLEKATLDFYDNQDVKTGQVSGLKAIDMSQIAKNQQGLYSASGLTSHEFREMMNSDKTIIVKVNADPAKIPRGLLFQSISDVVKTSPLMDQEKIHDVEQKAIKIGNNFLGRYNVKFVSDDDLDGQKPDFTFHVNIVDGIGTALADNTQVFTLGQNESFVALDQIELRDDFEKILTHEMGHVFLFQHPMGNADYRLPALMSYSLPVAQRMEKTPQSSGNIIPIIDFTPVELKLLEKHMEQFNRKPKIEKDLEIKIDSKSRGIYSSYNPDGSFSNIADFSEINLKDDFELVIVDAKNALSYCLDKCEPAIGLEDDKAVMLVSKSTKNIQSMAILSGHNPKIKISPDLVFDIDDLHDKGTYSIINSDSRDELTLKKFSIDNLLTQVKSIDKSTDGDKQKTKKITTKDFINPFNVVGAIALTTILLKQIPPRIFSRPQLSDRTQSPPQNMV